MHLLGILSNQELIFTVVSRTVKIDGWKDLYVSEENDEADDLLPLTEKGDAVTLLNGEIKELITKPPTRFTTASLLEAIKNIHKYLREPEYRKKPKTVSGIGTEATRAVIIDELISSGLLKQTKKLLTPSEVAEKLFDVLSGALTYPDMTALWEDRLARIAVQDFSYDSFL